MQVYNGIWGVLPIACLYEILTNQTNGADNVIRKYIENKYPLGDFMDIQLYPAFQQAKKGARAQREKPTSETQARLNAENASKNFDRLVTKNFSENDYILTLTYSELPKDSGDATRHFRNFIKRLQRIYKNNGVPLKYVYVTEYGKKGRCHYHMFVSGGVDRDILENAWKKDVCAGYANCRRLQFTTAGIKGITRYVSGGKNEKKEAEKTGFRKWNSSKNLIKPEVKQNKNRFRKRDIEKILSSLDSSEAWEQLYPDYRLAECDRAYYNPINGEYYISARLYKKICNAKKKAPPIIDKFIERREKPHEPKRSSKAQKSYTWA